MSGLVIRPIERSDQSNWRTIWKAYLDFYEASVDEAVYAATFERFFDESVYEPSCLVAEIGGRLVGLVHYFQHRHCWRTENVFYLQDLYVLPEARGEGAGRAMIEAVYADADRLNCPSVYWTTKTDNEAARTLYDRVGQPTDFMKYQRPAQT